MKNWVGCKWWDFIWLCKDFYKYSSSCLHVFHDCPVHIRMIFPIVSGISPHLIQVYLWMFAILILLGLLRVTLVTWWGECRTFGILNSSNFRMPSLYYTDDVVLIISLSTVAQFTKQQSLLYFQIKYLKEMIFAECAIVVNLESTR